MNNTGDAGLDYLLNLRDNAGDNRILREAVEAVLAERQEAAALETPAYVKSPIGVLPRWLWLERRLDDVMSAIKRYQEAGLGVPVEWVEERDVLIDDLDWERRKQRAQRGSAGGR